MSHQLISLAYGARTFKMKFGHRGANRSEKNLVTGSSITVEPTTTPSTSDSLEGTGLADARQPARRHGRRRECAADGFSRCSTASASGPQDSACCSKFAKIMEITKCLKGYQEVMVIGSGPIVIGRAAEVRLCGYAGVPSRSGEGIR